MCLAPLRAANRNPLQIIFVLLHRKAEMCRFKLLLHRQLFVHIFLLQKLSSRRHKTVTAFRNLPEWQPPKAWAPPGLRPLKAVGSVLFVLGHGQEGKPFNPCLGGSFVRGPCTRHCRLQIIPCSADACFFFSGSSISCCNSRLAAII